VRHKNHVQEYYSNKWDGPLLQSSNQSEHLDEEHDRRNNAMELALGPKQYQRWYKKNFAEVLIVH
jgi:hypothetical protein